MDQWFKEGLKGVYLYENGFSLSGICEVTMIWKDLKSDVLGFFLQTALSMPQGRNNGANQGCKCGSNFEKQLLH